MVGFNEGLGVGFGEGIVGACEGDGVGLEVKTVGEAEGLGEGLGEGVGFAVGLGGGGEIIETPATLTSPPHDDWSTQP